MKLKKITWEFIIIAGMITITLITISLITKNKEEFRKDIKNVVIEYMENLSDGEYEKMYAMVDQDYLDKVTKEDYISRNSNIFQGIHLSEAEVSDLAVEKMEDGTYEVDYRCVYETIAGTIDFTNKMTIVRRDGEYKILWTDQLIFPDLTADSKVSLKHLTADRGKILDRNGKVLAGEESAYSVGIVPGKMENQETTVTKMAQLLDLDEAVITRALGESWVKDDSFVPITVIYALSESDEEEINTQKQELLKVPGVMISETKTRVYPGKECTAHLIGYVREIDAEELEKNKDKGYHESSLIGKSGLEAIYEDRLRAQDGYEIMIVDAEGEMVKTLAKIKKKDGENIKLTIDYNLQKNLYEEFKEDNGCSVAMNPYTGEILALVSTPSYDANEFVRGLSTEKWNNLNNDENKPLLNRYKQIWCPGSTFKPIVAAIGVNTQDIDPELDFGYEGLAWQKDTTWGSYYVTTLHEYEPVVLNNALICSDNIYFAKAALKIGSEKLEANLKKLGFGAELPTGLGLVKSQYSNTDKIETEIQLADTGYGQGQLLVNPVHLASMYTGFLNQGDIIKPTLEYSSEGEKEVWIEDMFTADTVYTVMQGLKGVVNNSSGTGYAAVSYNYTLAGKTGTAELKSSKEDKDSTEIGWFSVFTTDETMEKPILLLSMVEDVSELGGSKYVVQKDKEILNMYIGY